ncbi:MAG TPA: Uma2 family endonuclease [Thermomicrobiales bacterium]|nr:Uma2 family endonuclease [Thermomicrobiales bacterium]
MAIETQINEDIYQHTVLADPDRKWELHDGRLREKPGMTWEHNRTVMLLGHLLLLQLDLRHFHVFSEGRVRQSTGNIYIPDIAVIPTAFGQEFENRPGVLAIFTDPLPLVIEVWSSSTGGYDVRAKLPEYQRRGDPEIWLIHPYERTLTAWRRQADGSYGERLYREEIVHETALPGVAIDLGALFDA